MNMLKAVQIALSMYSKIPMPKVEWTEQNMKYSLCFFPLVGLITGACQWLAGSLLLRSSGGKLLFAAVMTVLPLAVNGGIHMDGFLDTVDALSSRRSREDKLEILKDPHAGAFAILACGSYLVLSLGVWSEVPIGMLPVIGGSYLVSRALSGLAVVWFPAAKSSGLARTFQDRADQQVVRFAMLVWLAAAGALMVWNSLAAGLAGLGAAFIIFIYYRIMAIRQFGGITGDLAGYFLQLCELAMLAAIVAAGGGLWK